MVFLIIFNLEVQKPLALFWFVMIFVEERQHRLVNFCFYYNIHIAINFLKIFKKCSLVRQEKEMRTIHLRDWFDTL